MNHDEKTQEIDVPFIKTGVNKVVQVDFAGASMRAHAATPPPCPAPFAEVLPIHHRKQTLVRKFQAMDSEHPILTRLAIVLIVLLLSFLIL